MHWYWGTILEKLVKRQRMLLVYEMDEMRDEFVKKSRLEGIEPTTPYLIGWRFNQIYHITSNDYVK